MSGKVMVFAPAPILTVTIERPSGGLELHLHPGGQGIWQARMIRSLGARVTLCMCLGGEVGSVLEPLMAAEGLKARIVRRHTTSGWYVHDRRDGERVPLADSPGAPLTRHEIDELYGVALSEGLSAGVSVLSGPSDPSVVPANVYRRLAADLRSNGCRVVADLAGEYLDAVLVGGVTFLKVSHEEVLLDGRAADDSDAELGRALWRLRSAGAESVLISRSHQPSLALIDDDIVRVDTPRLEVADPRGAGDSMTAGVATVLARNGGLEEAIRTGAAAATLNVTRHGLGTGRARAITEMVARVRLTRVGSEYT